MITMKLGRIIAAGVLSAGLGFSLPANATTTIIDTGEGLATVTCDPLNANAIDPSCNGYTLNGDGSGSSGPQTLQLGTVSFTDSDVWILHDNGDQTERDALATVLGVDNTDSLTFLRNDTTFTNPFILDPSVLFFSVKFSTSVAFFQNLAFDTVQLTVAFLQGTGTGSGGLSHISTWSGELTEIPLPAALPMFLLALGGLGFVGRRRRQAAA